ncbi:surface carbohydrate biosynthesis protein [Thalassospira australica]|uniref:surface carbohydrate biosynthesis protein n=1 Tax=Thalassospira australica TaxID=1528106 RepID=UPI00384E1C91
MTYKNYIYLPIETKSRELDAKILLALEACSRGFCTIIGTKKINSILEVMPRGIYFYKDSSYPLSKRFQKYKIIGHKIVVHDEEGLIIQNDMDYLKRRVMFETIKHVDKFFCWGNHQLKLVESAKNIFSSNVKLHSVGHPRFDLLRPPINKYYLSQSEGEEKIILVNTKLAEFNHRLGENGWINLLKSHNMLHSEECLPLRREQKLYKEHLFYYYRELLIKISQKFPNHKIILRPHPAEDISKWESIASNLPNVTATKEQSIGYWLSRALAIIHTSCTTGIEAYIASVPAIAFKPIQEERFDNELPNKVSHIAESIEECINILKNILNKNIKKNIDTDIAKLLLHPYIDNISDNNFSYQTILNELETFPNEYMPIPNTLKAKLFIKKIMYNVIRKIRAKNGNERDIPYDELRLKVKILSSILEIAPPKITKISENIYMMRA